MRRSSIKSALEVCVLSSIATSTPLYSQTKLERKAEDPTQASQIEQGAAASEDYTPSFSIDCTDLHAIYDRSCWQRLHLSDWLFNSETGWNQTVPICSADGPYTDTSECCTADEPWSTCFLRLGTNTSAMDCSTIASRYCSLDVPVTTDPSIAPQVHYVIKNIVTLNNFFSTYYTALQFAVTTASLAIHPLVHRLDPLERNRWNWLNLLTMLAFGLAFLGIPAVGVAILELGATAKYAASALAISLMQAPATARAMWPIGTDESRMIQIGELNQKLSDASQELSNMITNANTLLMNDMTTFIKYVEGGQYSGPDKLSLPAKTTGLDFALKTYMTSVAMSKNGWYAVPNTGMFYDSFADFCMSGNGGHADGDYICGWDDGTASYWSPDTGRSYFLTKDTFHNNGGDHVETRDLLHEINDRGWAPLNLLFDGAYNCTAAGKSQIEDINFNWDGTLDVSCISQLTMRVGCGAYCELLDGVCPFKTNMTCVGEGRFE